VISVCFSNFSEVLYTTLDNIEGEVKEKRSFFEAFANLRAFIVLFQSKDLGNPIKASL
jgi:hypothetical protein